MSSPTWQILQNGIMYSFSLHKNPQKLPGPGTIRAMMHPVFMSKSTSPTKPSRWQFLMFAYPASQTSFLTVYAKRLPPSLHFHRKGRTAFLHLADSFHGLEQRNDCSFIRLIHKSLNLFAGQNFYQGFGFISFFLAFSYCQHVAVGSCRNRFCILDCKGIAYL